MYLLSTYNVPGSVLDAEATSENCKHIDPKIRELDWKSGATVAAEIRKLKTFQWTLRM